MIAGRGSLSGNADRWQSTNDINPVDIWNRFRIGCLVTFDDYSINLCISFLEISSLPTTSLNTIGKLEKKTSPPYTNSNEIRPIKQIQPERNIRRAKERDKVGWGQRMGKIIKYLCVVYTVCPFFSPLLALSLDLFIRWPAGLFVSVCDKSDPRPAAAAARVQPEEDLWRSVCRACLFVLDCHWAACPHTDW